ncbi:hypothetical protein [Enterococcus innesii]|nr:hypothetical protein [Enterococcus innesii]
MAKKDLSQAFLSAMSGEKQSATEEQIPEKETTSEENISLASMIKPKEIGKRKLVPVYLTDEEHEKLKEFAATNGYSRKVRGKDEYDGNLSALLQNLASQLEWGNI